MAEVAKKVGIASTALSLVLLVASCQGPTPARTSTSTSWLGLYPGNTGPAGVRVFERWLGRSVRYVTLFIDSSDWQYIDQPEDYGLQDYRGQPYQLILSVPMLPTDAVGDTLAQGATGAYNAHFSSFAQKLVAMGMGHAILRLGWEFASDNFPWQARRAPRAYAEYFRQIVETIRSVPGAHFRFDWNGGALGASWDPASAYPGNAYVDFVSEDVYDAGVGRSWSYQVGGPYGLDWLVRFGREHAKDIAIPEWGLQIRPDGTGGGDDATFVRDMMNFFTTHHVAYASYFNYDGGDGVKGDLLDGSFPNAAAAFRLLAGRPALSSTAA